MTFEPKLTSGSIDFGTDVESTEVILGAENVMSFALRGIPHAMEAIDLCGEEAGASTIVANESILNLYTEATKRGVKIRLITEITKKNILDCKVLMKCMELRHLDGLYGYFVIQDRKRFNSHAFSEKAKSFPHMVTSNVKMLVLQQQYFFNTLWEKAIPASDRIRELEEGVRLERTDIIHGLERIIQSTIEVAARTTRSIDNCIDARSPASFVKTAEVWKLLLQLKERGIKLRFITEILPDNVVYCKQLARVVELRHLDSLKGNFGIHDGREYRASASVQEGEPPTVLVTSTLRDFVEQQHFFFQTLWDKAIPAVVRIKDVEERREPEFLKVITDGKEAARIVIEFGKSVEEEALIMLPLAKTVVRMERAGVWDYLETAADRGAHIRVICPISRINEDVVKKLLSHDIMVLDGEPTTAGFFVADNRKYLRAESKDADAEDLPDALGLLEYSNSKSGIESFKAFFDIIWKQILSYQDLHNYSAMQKEFISTVAHELKTPVQPIIGLAQILRDKASDEDREFLDVIVRNAKRLVEMQDNILDVTRIESNNLRLKKDVVNLREVIESVVSLFRAQVSDEVELDVDTNDLQIAADETRISQVLSNMLSNAFRLTRTGQILVKAIAEEKEAVVTVKDTGPGLAVDVLPRLFNKFFTTSDKGTGLGLFISKNIVEAHGGKIWAKNNENGVGATFGFTIPLVTN